jgi:hypothetical protein
MELTSSVSGRANRPNDDHAVQAVDHRREIHLAGRDLKRSDICELPLIGRRGPKVALNEVIWRRADFVQVRSVPATLRRYSDQAFLRHQTLHRLLRDADASLDQRCLNPTVAITAVVPLEYLDDGATYFNVTCLGHLAGRDRRSTSYAAGLPQ